MTKLRRYCNECAWWEIVGNKGPLCWRPGDGPEPMPANEQACEWLADADETDGLRGKRLAEAYHGKAKP